MMTTSYLASSAAVDGTLTDSVGAAAGAAVPLTAKNFLSASLKMASTSMAGSVWSAWIRNLASHVGRPSRTSTRAWASCTWSETEQRLLESVASPGIGCTEMAYRYAPGLASIVVKEI